MGAAKVQEIVEALMRTKMSEDMALRVWGWDNLQALFDGVPGDYGYVIVNQDGSVTGKPIRVPFMLEEKQVN